MTSLGNELQAPIPSQAAIHGRRPPDAGGELTGGDTMTTGLTEEGAGGGTTLAGAPCAFEVTVVLWLP